jgi:uncharacterized heparinase superfamily protein
VRSYIDPISRIELRKLSGKFIETTRRSKSLLDFDTFFFLNEVGSLSEIGWDNLKREKLWRYNQHYFDDLNAVDAPDRLEWHKNLIKRWVDENPLGQGTGWEPYPISLRIVNWVKWSFAFNSLKSFELSESFNQSLATQVRWLAKRLEWHLLGNHLFANAKALVFAGLYFQGNEANAWLKSGLKIISRQVDEQVLDDGGNFERSPMYHAIFLEDLLDLINLANTFSIKIDPELIERWRKVAKKMFSWLKLMTHPDGQIALFNDAAFGVAPSLTDLEAYAARLGLDFENKENPAVLDNKHISIHQLKESGYICLSSKNAVAFLDVAPIGPDYLPGHAHADTLSFELSIYHQRVIVNGGTSCYGLGIDRLRERETLSHSTVEINGQSSSEVWSGFRVARRAYPFDLDVFSDSYVATIACSHDGYKRFPGKPTHRRTWEMSKNLIEVRDIIAGPYWQAIARFIIHPDITVSEITQGVFELKLPQGNLITFFCKQGLPSLGQASYAPEFGKASLTNCISVSLDQGVSSIEIKWT